LFEQAFGEEFVRRYVHIKEAELARYQSDVSDWELREYFEMFCARVSDGTTGCASDRQRKKSYETPKRGH
jgi:hypothetical protein